MPYTLTVLLAHTITHLLLLLTDDDFLKDSKLELYNEVIESLQEQEETTDVLDYEFDLEEE